MAHILATNYFMHQTLVIMYFLFCDSPRFFSNHEQKIEIDIIYNTSYIEAIWSDLERQTPLKDVFVSQVEISRRLQLDDINLKCFPINIWNKYLTCIDTFLINKKKLHKDKYRLYQILLFYCFPKLIILKLKNATF